jgi:hypothetical protein
MAGSEQHERCCVCRGFGLLLDHNGKVWGLLLLLLTAAKLLLASMLWCEAGAETDLLDEADKVPGRWVGRVVKRPEVGRFGRWWALLVCRYATADRAAGSATHTDTVKNVRKQVHSTRGRVNHTNAEVLC